MQGFVQPAARLAGGHGQQMAARFQVSQQGQHAVKQTDVVLMNAIVVPVALAELGVARLGHVGRGMGQRFHQPQADHIRGRCVAGHGAAHVGHRRLDAAHDDLR